MDRKKFPRFFEAEGLWIPALALAVLLLTVLLGRGEKETPIEATALPPLPAAEGLRIAVASDLHLDPDHTEKTAELGAVAYNLELVDALLYDAKQTGAELLLLTGDLVNGGKPHRHEALREKLSAAEAGGLRIFVLPGNHDLGPVGQQDFARYYAPFGYDEAASRDAASLSYSVRLEGLLLLMMDTGGYSAKAVDLPGAAPRDSGEACLSEQTLAWAAEQLKQAREEGLHVLCAGHYNLLPEISREPGSGFFVENGERFAELLQSFHVPLYLSGHMHLRAVYRQSGLTEQLTEYLLGYPSGYSVLDITSEKLSLRPKRVDVDAWAAATGQEDETLLHYALWQQQGLRSYAEETVAYMAERHSLNEREKKDAAAFFYAAMDAYWAGRLYEEREELEAMPGAAAFFRAAEGYSYGWWLKELMEEATPLMAGFTLAW